MELHNSAGVTANKLVRDSAAACRRYLEPLIAGEDYPPYENGLPRYARIRGKPVKRGLIEKLARLIRVRRDLVNVNFTDFGNVLPYPEHVAAQEGFLGFVICHRS